MAGKKFPLPLTILTLVVLIIPGVPIHVQAQLTGESLSSSLPESWRFTPPKRGNPDTEGAATRRPPDSSCIQGNQALTLLEPQPVGVTSTVMEYPSFFWYLPQTSARSVEFILRGDHNQVVYETTFAIAGTPGIVNLKLPTAAALSPLEVDKKYSWELSLICSPNDRAQDVFVKGLIQRISADPVLVSKIKNATLEERVSLYANARLWHETLTTLAQLRHSYPDDQHVVAAWKKLLNSAELNTFIEAPLLTPKATAN